jgi:predicted DNA-binding transcriptional regulator AlpA
MSCNDESQPSLFDDAPNGLPAEGHREGANPVAPPVSVPARKVASPRKPLHVRPEAVPSTTAIEFKPAQAVDTGVTAFLSVADVARRFSVSVPTIWRWAKTRPEFPKPVPLSPGTTRWRVSDLVAFEQSLEARA